MEEVERQLMYQQRFKDINAQKIIIDRATNFIEIYGEQLDGTTTWILIHINPSADIEIRKAQ